MNLLQAIFLGLIQGLTEFIPVSSSGHLKLAQTIMGLSGDNFHYFLEFINLGTLLALLIFFRKRIWQILQDIFLHRRYKFALNILITSIPAGVIGLILGGLIEKSDFFESIYTVMVAMGIVGIVMILIDKLPHVKTLQNESDLTPKQALGIGLAQTFALIPGISRSGSTIIAGRIAGLNSEAAAEYSFLASIPIMFGVVLRCFLSHETLGYLGENLGTLMFGNLVALISGLLALKFLLAYLKKPKSLQMFGVYRLVLSLVVLGILTSLA